MNSSQELRWEIDEFYWAQLELPKQGPRPTHEQLSYLLEAHIPQPLEEVHCAFVRVNETIYIGIAVPVERLLELPPKARSLTPKSLPAFLTADVSPHDFELLHGAFLPADAQAARRATWATLTIGALLTLFLVSFGVLRRNDMAESFAAQVEDDVQRLLQERLGPSQGAKVPPSILLSVQIRELEATTQMPSELPSSNASEFLASILRQWPLEHDLNVESIIATGDSASMTGTSPSAESVQLLADAIQESDGLQVRAPSIRSIPDGFRFDIQAVREATEE